MTALTQLDQFDFHHVLEEVPGPALVLFTAPACSSCQHWKQLLAAYRRDHPELAIFMADVQRDQALAAEFELFHLPAVFLFRDGHFHREIQCEARAPALEQAIATALAAPAQELP